MALLIARLRARLAAVPWRLAHVGWAGGGRAIGVLSIWWAWEQYANWRAHARDVRPNSLFRYRLTGYKGLPVTLNDGTVVQASDCILELHFDNRALARYTTSRRWPPWSALRLFSDDMDALACRARAGEFADIVALHGVSLYAPESRWLGCEFRPLPHTWQWRLLHFYLVGLAAIYHPRGWRGADRLREQNWPGELWLSIAKLRQRREGGGHRGG